MISETPKHSAASAPTSPSEIGSRPNAEPDDAGPARVAIRLSDDRMKAYIAINPPLKVGGGDLDAEFVMRRWREAGLDPEALAYDAAKGLADEWNRSHAPLPEREVAESAQAPKPGEPARIEYIVDPSLRFKPADQGGNVDFRNLNLIIPVKQGQPLAKKIPASPGAPGIDLYGHPAPAPDGGDMELPIGPNVEISRTDPGLIVASVAGFLQRKDGLLSVNECFIVEGSVDYSTGNITYDQSALIRGDIADGFTVIVGGALEVGGAVGESRLQVGGDVLIKKGFVGSGHGLITAKGAINLGFCSNQTLRAHGGLVVEKESFNCQLHSRRSITIYGPLVGGSTMALKEITCRVAGNDMGTRTELEAGMDYVLHENKILIEEKIKELTGHLGKINRKLAALREGYRVRKRFTSMEARILLELRDMQEKIQARLPELERRKLEIAGSIRLGYQSQGILVRVEKKINPGVIIKIGAEVLRIQEVMAGPKTFAYLNGRIKTL